MQHAVQRADEAAVPVWTRAMDALIDRAASQARVIGICTPRNAPSAVRQLTDAIIAGQPRIPELLYDLPRRMDLRPTLERAAEACMGQGPLGRSYAERLVELSVEIALCERAGKQGFSELAAKRFARHDEHDDEADRVCERWIDTEPSDLDAGPTVVSDDAGDPRSLIRRLREEVGARRLPVRTGRAGCRSRRIPRPARHRWRRRRPPRR